jgi:hypothetical protein
MAALLMTAATALADTCCANTAVGLEPRVADVGDTVAITGIVCLDYDNSGPLQLNLFGFWLSPATMRPDPNPGDAPGDGQSMPVDVPRDDQWLAFRTVSDAVVGSGSGTIVVPPLPRGSYQLWWRCDNGGGPGSGIHYSAGPRLQVGGGGPDTATSASTTTDTGVLAAIGVLGSVVLSFAAVIRRRARPDRLPVPKP